MTLPQWVLDIVRAHCPEKFWGNITIHCDGTVRSVVVNQSYKEPVKEAPAR